VDKTEKYKKIKKLINQQTRAEIMARFGQFNNLDFANYAYRKVELDDEIRVFLFGTSDLVELGERWGLLKPRERKGKKRRDSKPEIIDKG
jgi:hypothetical protein